MMRNLVSDTEQALEIINYVAGNSGKLEDPLSMMLFIQATMEYADTLKPLYLKLKEQNKETFIMRL